MPQFKYKAVKVSGEEYEGEVVVPTRFELYKHVRAEGGTVLSVTERNERKIFNLEQLNTITERVKESDKITLAKNLGAMIDAGLPLSRALSVIGRQTKNKKLKRIFGVIEKDIQGGINLHTSFARFPRIFSPLMVSMVRAGEESGKLAEALKTVADQTERMYLLKKRIRGALIYPSIIVAALAAVGVLMLLYVVPVLRQTFEELEVELPASTQFVISTSAFLTDNTLLALGISAALIILFTAGVRTEQGKRAFHFLLIHIPIINKITKELNAARTARTFSSLLSSGVEVVSALGITEDVVQNTYFKEIIEKAQGEVQRGQPMAAVFGENEDLYPVLLSEMVAIGEETGKLPEMLLQVAEFYENEVEQRTKNISTVIEPFLMIFVGAVVGFFALSMITPIYSLSSSI